MNLKIKSLSLKLNYVHLFWGGTFGAGPQKLKLIIMFHFLWGPAPKVVPQNK